MNTLSSSPVGIVGVGLMGSAFYDRLTAAGFTGYGWDRDESRCRGAASAAEVFAWCDRVILSLPNSDVVAEVLRSISVRPGQVVIDTSTGDPQMMTELAGELAQHGAHYLDATISGSSAQVHNGEVLVMVGGNAAAFEQCRDLFATFSREAIHVGPSGSGAKMKLVTNLVLGLNRVALAEGLVFAQELGVELKQALDVLRRSMAYSRIMDTKGEKMVNRDFTPQAQLLQHLKDVRLMLSASRIPLPMTETHRKLLERAVAQGYGELDNSAVIQVIQDSPE
jgi:3-hydroxyisobutyrate dehydrogenase-like beta-hydroxyacid dehydrogenase